MAPWQGIGTFYSIEKVIGAYNFFIFDGFAKSPEIGKIKI
jgi:hypothetical protein